MLLYDSHTCMLAFTSIYMCNIYRAPTNSLIINNWPSKRNLNTSSNWSHHSSHRLPHIVGNLQFVSTKYAHIHVYTYTTGTQSELVVNVMAIGGAVCQF